MSVMADAAEGGMLTVTIYTTGPACVACKQTKRHLDKRGIPYTEISINDNIARAGIRTAIAELNLKHAPVVCASTPTGEQVWDGYRPDRIDGLVA